MARILIINGHQPYPFAEGRLNAALVERAKAFFVSRGDEVRVVETAKDYDPEVEVGNHQWADTIVMQFPVNWMGVPWSFKKYQDDVYTAGMDGRLCAGDGRTAEAPKENYGAGGSLIGKTYMLSLTFNAPREAFDDAQEFLFQGRSVDDLMMPMHMNARFFGLNKLPTFAAYDVMKNPDIENDFVRFDAHLSKIFKEDTSHAAA
ncbi:NAD(P)H-dependent oxidoreductase [Labrenzia sp. R4_2]|uniref:NAD(P)H-dependent oxidoreductase n=1 Tax=Labrenzia sp. R4_2 TaxID=2821107 RepID=UPI001ADD6181|nr:NAD(P)H-dependent oxidoreductase [Labrenzia sp. R4_2]MBO9421148.1 NAD(P)H-dependent oxidoreductase [Labrenzia sp. R4_2]